MIRDILEERPFIMVIAIVMVLAIGGFVGYKVYSNHKDVKDENVYEDLRENAFKPADQIVQKPVAVKSLEEVQKTQEERIEEFLNTCGMRDLYEEPLQKYYPDFDSLKECNQEVVAYLDIPGTDISYPVLQSETDGYYLKHGIDGSYGNTGCLYIEKYNNLNFTDSVNLIYGHHKTNGTMFGKLTDFADEAFRNEHPYLIVYTPEQIQVYKVEITSKYKTIHLLTDDFYADAYGDIRFNTLAEDEPLRIVQKIKEYEAPGAYISGTTISLKDQLLVLSTCCDNSKSRYLVVGRRIV